MKKFTLLAALALGLVACTPAEQAPAAAGPDAGAEAAGAITVVHAQGEIVLPARPQRVIVQDTATLDIVDARIHSEGSPEKIIDAALLSDLYETPIQVAEVDGRRICLFYETGCPTAKG